MHVKLYTVKMVNEDVTNIKYHLRLSKYFLTSDIVWGRKYVMCTLTHAVRNKYTTDKENFNDNKTDSSYSPEQEQTPWISDGDKDTPTKAW